MLAASGGGVSVPPDDPAEFAQALGDLLADPSRRASMGTAGRRWVESAASPPAVAEAYERLVESLARRRPADRHRRSGAASR